MAKLTPPPQLFLFSSMYDLPWGEGRKKQKKNYVITKTIVSARLFFLFSFGLRGFFFVYFIFVEHLLFHSIPAFDFLSKIESAFLEEKKCYEKILLFLSFHFFPYCVPFLFGSKNILNFPYCSISLISAVCFSVFSRPKKNSLWFFFKISIPAALYQKRTSFRACCFFDIIIY